MGCALVLLLSALMAPPVSADALPKHGSGAAVAVDESWNAIFDRRDGWTGADVAGSVDLGDRRILWLFGDTWIGSIREGKRVPGARMVNNSIAIQRVVSAVPPKDSNADSIRFYWGPNDAKGNPTAWAVPENRQTPSENRTWFWTTGGGLVVPGAANSRRLIVFFFRVEQNPHGKGVWNFSVVGTAIGLVDNVAESPDRWKLRLQNIPDSMSGTQRPGEAATTTWGLTASLDAKTARGAAPDALIYGVRKTGPWNSSLVLARAPASTIDQFTTWRFYAGSNSWTSTPKDAAEIADATVSELSVEHLSWNGQTDWVLVQSEPFLGRQIFVRTAPNPEGPWSVRHAIYSVPDVNQSRSYFMYAAKGHAGLSQPGELLVSYLVNSQQFSDLQSDTTIYRPKFIRVPLSQIFAH